MLEDDEDYGICYLPTPEEIAAQCAVIRAGWSPAETLRRTVQKCQRVATMRVSDSPARQLRKRMPQRA